MAQKTCPECGYEGSTSDFKHHDKRVDHADPSITVTVMVTCPECGYPV